MAFPAFDDVNEMKRMETKAAASLPFTLTNFAASVFITLLILVHQPLVILSTSIQTGEELQSLAFQTSALNSVTEFEMETLKNDSAEIEGIRPILVMGPKDEFVVRNRPATLTCRALYAKSIRFKCNGKWVDTKDHVTKEGKDLVSGLPYLESSIPVERKEVEEYFGFDGFQCECYASNGNDNAAIKSDKATVKVAYLRKFFYRSPSSEQKRVGSTVQLPCLPPDGDPKPEVFWLKNGVDIDRGMDSNVILANDGSLIISAARISDSGNYTCGAWNLATRRLTDTVRLIIYVDGSWSEWSAWSGNCDVDCGRLNFRRRQKNPSDLVPKLKRYHSCTNPPPQNGGKMCFGAPEQEMDCPIECPVDGGWTHWTKWSRCGVECEQFQTRQCADPLPKNGGRICHGADIKTRNCTSDHCAAGKTGSFGGSASWESSLAMYAGLSVALLLFVVLFTLIIWLLVRRRKCCTGGKDQDDTYYAGNAGHLRTVLNMQPDLTHNAIVTYDGDSLKKKPFLYPPTPPVPELSSFSLRSAHSLSTAGYGSSRGGTRDNLRNMSILANSKAALLEGSSSQSSHPPSIDSAEKQRCLSRTSRNSDENYATLYDFEPCEEEQENQRNSIISSAFPSHIEVDSLAVGKFDHRGGRLSLPHCGVSLLIPDGALEKRCREELYIAVCRDPSDRPKLADKETLLSPVIWCGPPGVTFLKPVVLSFPHCAQLFPLNNWNVCLFMNEGLPEDSTDWMNVVTLGQENINTPVYCQLDLDSVHVMTESLCRFAAVGYGRPEQVPAVKRMKLAGFAPLYPSTLDYSLRVYCIEDTDASIQGVIEEEERLGGYMVADVRDFSCQEGGDLCCCLEDVSPGWQVKPGANYQEIPAAHVWHGVSGLHCSFSLELAEGVQNVRNLSARIVVYQKGAPSARQIIQVNTAMQAAERVASLPRSSSAAQTVVRSTGSGSSARQSPASVALLARNGTPSTSSASHPTFRLPPALKKRICAALDPPTESENDWRMLARKLNVDRYIQYFGFRSSPTEHILDLWEAREPSPAAITRLLQILRNMGRLDVAALLETFLSQNPVAL